MRGSPAGRRVGIGPSGVGTFRQGVSVSPFPPETVRASTFPVRSPPTACWGWPAARAADSASYRRRRVVPSAPVPVRKTSHHLISPDRGGAPSYVVRTRPNMPNIRNAAAPTTDAAIMNPRPK